MMLAELKLAAQLECSVTRTCEEFLSCFRPVVQIIKAAGEVRQVLRTPRTSSVGCTAQGPHIYLFPARVLLSYIYIYIIIIAIYTIVIIILYV